MTQPAAPCEARPESSAYVAQVEALAQTHWVSDGLEPGSEVTIAFRLDESGRLMSFEVRGGASKSSSYAARRALAGGEPYPPMPEAAKCLAGVELVTSFRAAGERARARPGRIERPPSSGQAEEMTSAFRWIKLATVAAALFAAFRYAIRPRPVEGVASSDPASRSPRVFVDRELRFFSTGPFESASLLLAAHLLLIAWHGPTTLALLALFDLGGLVEFVHSRRAPLVRMTEAEIEVDTSAFRPVRRIGTTKLASWAASVSLLGLRELDGRDVWIPVSLLPHADRHQLVAFVRGLPLVGAGQPPLTLRELSRREARRYLAALAIAAAVPLLELLVHG